MAFATDLAAARERLRLNRRDACAALFSRFGISISERALGGYERGEREPEPLKQRALLDALERLAKWSEGEPNFEPASQDQKTPAESNATLLDLGPSAIWIPYYPATLGAAHDGQDPLDIEPEGGFPLPSSFARRIGLTGNLFSAGVTGDSMREELDEGDVVFGIRQREWDREAIYALYLDGGLLVKRIVRVGKRYELVSTNPAYPPRPVASEDAYIIGRVVGSVNRL